MVQAEKEDMLHVLDFPYNGETRFNHIMENKLTDNKYHLCAGFTILSLSFIHDVETFSRSIRNHGGVPDIDEDAFYLDIGGLVNTEARVYLRDLKDPEQYP